MGDKGNRDRSRTQRDEMSKKQETIRPKPSDYGIDIRDPELAQALADLIEMGLG